MFGVDYSWARPSPPALRSAGVQFVCRYLSGDTSKDLSIGEARELCTAGLWIVVVWESGAEQALGGYAAGAADAGQAVKLAESCGMPAGRPVFFAVDFDAAPGSQAAINDYLDGAASSIGRARVGIYGGYWPVSRALDAGRASWAWQTYAWSGGNWDARASIRQYLNGQTLAGASVDFDSATTTDYGQWRIDASPVPEEVDMPYGQLADGADAVTPIALPVGKYHEIGFFGDNGLQGKPAAKLRVAIHARGRGWDIHEAAVDSAHGQTVITFAKPADTDGVSVERTDTGDVQIGWEIS
jgi:hypothetical protein